VGGCELSDEDRAVYTTHGRSRTPFRGGLNYYRAARMGEQVAARGVPEEYESRITSQTVKNPDARDLGRE